MFASQQVWKSFLLNTTLGPVLREAEKGFVYETTDSVMRKQESSSWSTPATLLL